MQELAARLGALQGKALQKFAEYAGVAIVSLIILYQLMELSKADFRIPFSYGGDAQTFLLFIKSIVDEGWVLHNNYVGMPYGLALYDFPLSDTFTFLLIKFFSFFTKDHGLIFNLFFISHFPFTALTSFYVFRHFGVRWLTATAGALLYTFIPYHLTRSQGHCFYAGFYAVPLIVMVALWIASDKFTIDDLFSFRQNAKKIITTLGICLLLASTGTFYYAFFACALLLSVGILVAVRHQQMHKLLLPVTLIVFIVFSLAANVLPNLIYFYRHGTVGVVERSPADAEMMGLKIAQLLLPASGHRIEAFAEIKKQYDSHPFTTENTDSSLGIIGSIGFLVLVGWILFRRNQSNKSERTDSCQLIDYLSVMNATALLVATIGGFGTLVAFFVLPQIRSYNRISVFIAFFSFFTVVLLADRMTQRWVVISWQKAVWVIVLIVIVSLGVMDEVSPKLARLAYEGMKVVYQEDTEFVELVETSLPTGAMIFQFPYIPFPEGGTQGSMLDYDLLKGYLHSHKLRWSFGAMRGRSSDLWQQQLVAKQLPEIVQTLAYAGFNAIYIDRHGYKDNAVDMERQLSELTAVTPVISKNQRLAVYDLATYKKKLQDGQSQAEWNTKQEEVLHPLFISWSKGFYGLEGEGENSWRWCKRSGELHMINTSTRTKSISLQFMLKAENEGDMLITSSYFVEKLKVNQTPQLLTKSLVLPPGEHILKFVCNAPKVIAPGDPRELIFNVSGFKRSSE